MELADQQCVASSLEDFERLCQLLENPKIKRKKKKSSESQNCLYEAGIICVFSGD